jgi:two-component system LytT family sensor kinase
MNALHGSIPAGDYFVGQLIGYTTGLLLAVLLLVLTLRAGRLPGTPVANIAFAVCAVLWTAGGLMCSAMLAGGIPPGDRPVLLAYAIQYCGAAASPIPVLAIWRDFASGKRQRIAALVVLVLAGVAALAISTLVWMGVAPDQIPSHTGYTAAILLLLGAAVSLRRSSVPRSVYLPSLVIVAALCGSLATMNPHAPRGGWVQFVGSHLVLLVGLGAFLLFARFRYADVFIRYGVRILLAGMWAIFIANAAQYIDRVHATHRKASPGSMHVVLLILVSSAVLLSFTFFDDRFSTWLNRWLFRAPDYRACLRQVSERLRLLNSDADIAAAVEAAARDPLELSSARVVALDSLPPDACPPGVAEGQVAERNFEVWTPIASSGRISHALVALPGPVRPGLLAHDLNYLRALAAQCGNRFDALLREQESVELQSREALLQQQVSEAELRALRAQINPHFLFNSLNTIADLVVRNPARAEAMTLRLASVFRHVLANSARPLTPLRDEIEFLRTYLHIEEARFGDRLTVRIDIAPEVAGEPLPSLILQPLVENALKHGLAPKTSPGHLWISAHVQDDQVCLCVEDDGLGPVPGADSRSGAAGVGLANVAERLATLYQDRASFTLEARSGGGSRATVLIPRSARPS